MVRRPFDIAVSRQTAWPRCSAPGNKNPIFSLHFFFFLVHSHAHLLFTTTPSPTTTSITTNSNTTTFPEPRPRPLSTLTFTLTSPTLLPLLLSSPRAAPLPLTLPRPLRLIFKSHDHYDFIGSTTTTSTTSTTLHNNDHFSLPLQTTEFLFSFSVFLLVSFLAIGHVLGEKHSIAFVQR